MSDRPTPETDKETRGMSLGFGPSGEEFAGFVPSDFARRLERERDRLREINRELLEALEECLVAGVLSAPATLQARAAIAKAKGGEG